MQSNIERERILLKEDFAGKEGAKAQDSFRFHAPFPNKIIDYFIIQPSFGTKRLEVPGEDEWKFSIQKMRVALNLFNELWLRGCKIECKRGQVLDSSKTSTWPRPRWGIDRKLLRKWLQAMTAWWRSTHK